jgi:hypothetical protein
MEKVFRSKLSVGNTSKSAKVIIKTRRYVSVLKDRADSIAIFRAPFT